MAPTVIFHDQVGFGHRQGPLDKGLHGGIDRVVKQRGGQNAQVRRHPFGKKFLGHVVLVDALAGCFGPAGVAPGADPDLLVLEIHHLDLRPGAAHTFNQRIEHHFGLAVAARTGT